MATPPTPAPARAARAPARRRAPPTRRRRTSPAPLTRHAAPVAAAARHPLLPVSGLGRAGPSAAASVPAMVSAALTPGAPASAPVAGTLDGRIQDAKADVIKLNRDLLVLEEELLFPANTQVALFVSMDVGKMFQLDSVQVKLDDKVVANYLYTALEVEALHRGGVQRVYLGNLKSGKHELVAFFTGKGPHERDYKRGANVKFEKTPKRSTSSCASRTRPASFSPSSTSSSGSDRPWPQVLPFASRSASAAQPLRRRRSALPTTAAFAAWPFGASAPPEPTHEIKAPHYGDACYYFFQDRYFTSITTLMASQQFDRVVKHDDEAEILRGGMLASYGLTKEAGEIFARLIDRGRAAGARPRLVLSRQDPLPARLPAPRPKSRSPRSSGSCRRSSRKSAACCSRSC